MRIQNIQEVLTIDFRRPVPVFPLPDCVLFPHTLLPLHIYEPRYRKLVEDALDDIGLIALGLFEDMLSDDEYLRGRPPLRPWVCVGLVRSYEKTPDGQYILLLQGICRGKLLAEVPHEPYRTFTVEPADTAQPSEAAFQDVRLRLESLAEDDTFKSVAAIRKAREHMAAEQPIVAMVDSLLSELLSDAEQRYAMLAEADPSARASWLLQYMTDLRDRTVGDSTAPKL